MTEKDFFMWLNGYIFGKDKVDTHPIQEMMKQITSEKKSNVSVSYEYTKKENEGEKFLLG